jgi:hypothetical protein
MNKKILVAVVVIVVAVVGILFYFHSSQTAPTTSAPELSKIQTPSGWHLESESSSTLLFTNLPTSSTATSDSALGFSQITASAIETQSSTEQWIVSYLDRGQQFDPAQTWDVINGKLLLKLDGALQGGVSSSDYYLFNKNIVYFFTLEPYMPPHSTQHIANSVEDTQTVQTMIESFAKAL